MKLPSAEEAEVPMAKIGPMPLPDGAVALIRAIWFIENIWLVTAYPLRHKKKQ
jgi:hypothetical protein